MTKLCWLTDVHLNFIDKEQRFIFYDKIRDTESNAILLTGDIAEAPSIVKILKEFSVKTELPIYFVLGNHDFYFGNVNDVRSAIIELTAENSQLVWLGNAQCVDLSDNTILIGQDTWADGRNGDYYRSSVRLNDSTLIDDLFQATCMSRGELLKKMQQLADDDAKKLEETLQQVIKLDKKNIMIACHVPPFVEVCWHLDQQSDENWLPYFSSKIIGDLLLKYSNKYQDINFIVYCGHTHTARDYQAAENLYVRAGGSEYFQPKISDIIQV